MCCGARPVGRTQMPEALHQVTSVTLEAGETVGEIHAQQQIIGILLTGQVRLYHRLGLAQQEVEPVEEEPVHVREVAGMLVRRPALRFWPTLENLLRDLAHHRDDDLWRAL